MSSYFPQGTFFDLGLMTTSLDAFQEALTVTSDNIANVSTPGASRQQVQFQQVTPIAGSPFYSAHTAGTFGDGVTVSQVQRIHSNSYDALFRGASSSQNYYTIESQQLQSLQSTLGDPTSGVNALYGNFQTAVNQLVAQYSSGQTSAVSANVLATGQALASGLNTAANAVQQQETSVVQQAGSLVTTVNGILDQIAALNGQIRASTAVGDSPNTYLDQRDLAIDTLSQYVSTSTAIQPDGSVLVTVGGQALVNDTVAYHLAAPPIGTAATGQPTFDINFATLPPGAASTPSIPLGSGQLAAFQDLYNNKLVPYAQQLDSFAGSLANEVNRITTSSYDQNGQPGTALFQPIVASLPISAGNIKIGITDPSQLPVALANTGAGTLVVPLNSANNTVDTSQALTNNASLANPPAAALAGNLTVTVNGVSQTFAYNTGVGGNADTINDFITNFNAAHMGVTASFNATGQTIVFARDPSNEDLALRGAQGSTPSSPTFAISDSNFVAGTPAVSLVGVLGASGINGVTQNATNAFAASDNGGANAMLTLFGSNVGVPPIQQNSPTAAVAGTPVTIALLAGVNEVPVGQVLTLDAQKGGGPPQENVSVSAVSYNPATGIESITFTPQQNHAVNFTVASAQVQTLGQYYGQFITQVGLDTQTANTGTTTQTSLANNLNQARQSIAGINIDEETQHLIQYQNAYQAAARTINVMGQILQTTITSLGVGG